MPPTPSFTVEEICTRVQGRLIGPGDRVITSLCGMDQAVPGQLSFIASKKFTHKWATSKASAAVISEKLLEDLSPGEGRALIVVPDAELAMVTVLSMFAPPPPRAGLTEGVHPTAIVDPSATLGKGVRIGAHSIIGPGAVIGDGTTIHAHVAIYDHARIGANCTLWPHVVIRELCVIGDRCLFHPGVSIGADGFGYRPSPDGKGLLKVPQIGNVIVGDDVEIGANSCIDRGKFGATTIGSGTKIDNLCQIGHNCKIGRCVIIISQVGLSGSVTVEDGAILAGQVGVADHVTIHAGAKVGAQSGVMADIPAGKSYLGTWAREAREFFRINALLTKLPQIAKALKLEKPSE